MKYDRYKAMNGYYTRIWRKFRPGLANIYELDKRLVRARVWIDDKLLTPSTHN